MMETRHTRKLFQTFIYVTILTSSARAGFRIDMNASSSLMDREARIVPSSEFDLEASARKLLTAEEVKKKFDGTMDIVQTKLVKELKEQIKASNPESVDTHCSPSIKFELIQTQDGKYDPTQIESEFIDSNGNKLGVYKNQCHGYNSTDTNWRFDVYLFDQGGENSQARENYNLMIIIKALEAGNDKVFYEEKHLLVVDIAKEKFEDMLTTELSLIIDAFKDEKKNPSKESSLSEIDRIIHAQILKALDIKADKDESVNLISSEEAIISRRYKLAGSFFESMEVALSAQSASFAKFEAKIGSRTFNMSVPRRGLSQNEVQIKKTFESSFQNWLKSALKKEKATGQDAGSGSASAEYFSFEKIKDLVEEIYRLKFAGESCYKELKECKVPQQCAEQGSYFRFVTPDANANFGMFRTLVIHLENNNQNKTECLHDDTNRMSSDHVNIFITHYTAGSLNYGLLSIESETQSAESLIDFSKNIKQQIEKEIRDFIKSDKYVNLNPKNRFSFDISELFKIFEKNKISYVKCIVKDGEKDKVPNTYQAFLADKQTDVEPFFQSGIAVMVCMKPDKEKLSFENVVLKVLEKDGGMIEMDLAWPKNFNQERIKGTFAESCGVDVQYTFPAFNSYDQLKDKIEKPFVAFLQLVGDDEEASKSLTPETFCGQKEVKAQRKLKNYQPAVFNESGQDHSPLDQETTADQLRPMTYRKSVKKTFRMFDHFLQFTNPNKIMA
jgi:hypothetical protein